MSYPPSRYRIDLIEGSDYTDGFEILNGVGAALDLSGATLAYTLVQGGAIVAQPTTAVLVAGDGTAQATLDQLIVDTLSGVGTWSLTVEVGTDKVIVAGGTWVWNDVATGAGIDPPPASRTLRVPYLLGAGGAGHGTGSVTEHSDVSSAGSGIIISAAERTAIATNTASAAAAQAAADAAQSSADLNTSGLVLANDDIAGLTADLSAATADIITAQATADAAVPSSEIVSITQAAYDALSPPVAGRIYNVIG